MDEPRHADLDNLNILVVLFSFLFPFELPCIFLFGLLVGRVMLLLFLSMPKCQCNRAQCAHHKHLVKKCERGKKLLKSKYPVLIPTDHKIEITMGIEKNTIISIIIMIVVIIIGDDGDQAEAHFILL